MLAVMFLVFQLWSMSLYDNMKYHPRKPKTHYWLLISLLQSFAWYIFYMAPKLDYSTC